MLTEPEQERVDMFIALRVAQSVNSISIGIPVRAMAQLDVEM